MTELLPGKQDIRVDKWLWAVRLFKTRNLSAEACRKGKVHVNGQPVKPSRILKPGDIINIRRAPSVYTYRVKGLVEKRQSASLVEKYLENHTPAEEIDKSMHKNLMIFSQRDPGSGRPTKRDRRIIDRLRDQDQQT